MSIIVGREILAKVFQKNVHVFLVLEQKYDVIPNLVGVSTAHPKILNAIIRMTPYAIF
jgi:hypothetical protein